MKRTLLPVLFIIITLSCEKTGIDLSPDIPQWLANRIEADKLEAGTEIHSESAVSAWVRYSYQDKYYFENVSLFSSLWPKVYRSDRTEFEFSDSGYSNYQTGKCCKLILWKGPLYPDTIN